ncbi:Zn(2)-C6 fungal-type domain-containing protein [Mycena kentingensis (nom. inval.)]|nr:Zn(2)-C6 fungal-type domain-containing protein [Mycena kentingensis (nom. inval.)]
MGASPKDKEDRPRKKPGRVYAPTSLYSRNLSNSSAVRLAALNIPCGKCVQRGCSAICPEGQLASAGKGNRLVLANTEELHQRIETLCSRIRELEDGLRTLNDSCTDIPHALLHSDLLQIKLMATSHFRENVSNNHEGATAASSSSPPSLSLQNGLDPVQGRSEEENFIDAFGTLTIGPHGESSFIGQTARSEANYSAHFSFVSLTKPQYLLSALSKPMVQKLGAEYPSTSPRLSRRITEIAFPHCEVADPDLTREVMDFLPSLSEAIRLCDTYLHHGAYLTFTLQRKELLDDVVDAVYRAPTSSILRPHPSLSLLFSVFAIATLLDPKKHSYSVEAQEFLYLARASLSLSLPVKETTMAAVQSLLHMAHYMDIADWEGSTTSTNAAWLYLGTAVRLGYSLGLHLDSSRWKLPEEAAQRRTRLFWQLFISDTLMSFSIGRPVTMSANQVDCPSPNDPPEVLAADNGRGLSFFSWMAKYSVLLHNVVTTAFGTRGPGYNTVLELDRKIRDFYIPTQLRPTCGAENPPPPDAIFLQRFLVLQVKETSLLNLHRPYFGQALQEKPDDLASHKWIPSVMAAYRSAWRLIRGLVILWRDHSHLLTRLGPIWSPALSAAIVMCMLVVRSPSSKMAPSSLEELDALARVFQDAAASSRFAAHLVQPVLILHRKAHQIVDSTPPNLYDGSCNITPADLDRLGGGTTLISPAPPTDAPSPGSSIDSRVTPGSARDSPRDLRDPRDIANLTDFQVNSPAGSGSISGTPSTTTNPDLAMPMHPTIAQDMRSFDLGEPSLFYGATFAPEDMAGVQFHGLAPFNPPQMNAAFGGFNMGALQGYGNTGGTTPPMLDATWQSFVEQLGF